MRVLFIGDMVGKPGRRALEARLDRLVDQRRVDFTVVNVENAADGLGITPDIAEDLFALGAGCLTSGNHIWDKREIRDYIAREPRLLRPANYPQDLPGKGIHIGETAAGHRIAVVNVMGRVFMPPVDDPFRTVADVVREARRSTPVVIVDMHAEATSEKMAMGWHLDGQVSAVLGTHTHVQTADERILPGGTAYITDVGMTGPYDSVIGMDKQAVLSRFLNHTPSRMTAARGDVRLCAVLVDVDSETGRAASIERMMLGEDQP
ncbi:MAG TPA: TIGR00282 family metallophosphoesterase [Candidatus Polarisedimenticolia bacterium]|nr:TIGR00282 family metallophosphoesterase [Candidatus Polarisedimenticolia bacterium]